MMKAVRRALLAGALGSPVLALLGCGEGTAPEPAVIIPQTTHVIPASVFAAQLESISPDSTTFVMKRGNALVDGLRSGDLLVSEAGLGILRKILGTSDSAGHLVLRTTQGSLTEAIEKGSASFTGTISQQAAGMKVLYQAPGVRATENTTAGTAGFYLELRDLVVYDVDGDPGTQTDRILANGIIELTPSFTFAVVIDHFALQDLTMAVTLNVRDTLELSTGASLPLLDVSKEVLRVQSAPIVTLVGSVPVVITPVFSIDVGATGELYASVVTSISQENTLTGGLRYEGGVWTPIANEQHSFGFEPPVLSAGALLKGYVGPRFTFLLYGVVGPYANVSLYCLVDADVLRDPWARLYGGVELGAGVRLEVLSLLLADYEDPSVIGVRVLLWESSITPPSEATFAAVDAGGTHTCGVTTRGVAYCWGSNARGSLGDGTLTIRTTPVPVSDGLTFATVSAGGGHTCGLTTSGVAYCWGQNVDGQVGDGTTADRTTPVLVSLGLTFAAVSSGWYHTCGVTTSGVAYCWGNNTAGQLGDGTSTSRTTPGLVSGALTFAAVDAGRYHTCGVTTGGVAYCWGNNAAGQLGDGTTTDRTTPVLVSDTGAFSTIAAGHVHSCAVATSGVAYCWGWNLEGQLGDGTLTTRTTPVPVSGGLTFAVVSTKNRHTCGVTTNGVAYCWGWNANGQLGDGTFSNIRTTPRLVSGGLTFAAGSAGGFHTCGVTTSSVAYCWGFNGDGELGDGTRIDRLVPVAVGRTGAGSATASASSR